jgi:hypothetical protein
MKIKVRKSDFLVKWYRDLKKFPLTILDNGDYMDIVFKDEFVTVIEPTHVIAVFHGVPFLFPKRADGTSTVHYLDEGGPVLPR